MRRMYNFEHSSFLYICCCVLTHSPMGLAAGPMTKQVVFRLVNVTSTEETAREGYQPPAVAAWRDSCSGTG